MENNFSKIIAISVSGIGNTVLFTPFLSALRKKFPQAEVDILVWNEGMSDAVSGGKLVDNIFIFPKNFFKKIILILKLRKRKYDCSVVAFPSNKWQFNALVFLIGAKERITHSYAFGKIRTLSFLQNRKIRAIEGIHDVDQDMNLLAAFGVSPESEGKKLSFFVSDGDRAFAEKFLNENGIGNMALMGIHPGAGRENDKSLLGEAKRWPAENFSKLCDKIIEKKNYFILVFGGPGENNVKEEVKKLSKYKEKILVINQPLKKTAALIERCGLFVSNDSGLMHIAAALEVPTVGIFGPVDYRRVRPYGEKCLAVSDHNCKPIFKYPFHSTSAKINLEEGLKCLENIKVENVLEAVERITKL
ncbi:glycosyltransferase family 9 protein [Candidatus Wolfebacteria bacterium]|nr:glycosyltransferase family 9 protein [Candidatus Wolfebacteria bacterium]